MTAPTAEAARRIARSAAQIALQLQIAGRHTEAVTLYEKALELNPELVLGWCNLGVARRELQDIDGAEEALQQALRLNPRHATAMANMAAVLEAQNRPVEARSTARSALALAPGQPVPRLVLARLERAAGDAAAALGQLEGLHADSLPPHLVPRLHTERGMALDRLRSCDEAFASFLLANKASMELKASREVDAGSYPRTVSVMRQRTPALLRNRRQGAPEGPAPVFVLGFPRSGTTLTETILSAHPALRGSDELPLLESVLTALPSLLPQRGASYPNALGGTALRSDEVCRLRAAYWAEADAQLGRGSAHLVDKLPLNLVHVAAISAIFPDAPLVLVLRDPRDVCLSCFMQDFVPNSAMVQMQSLERIVSLQEQVMGLWLENEQSLPNRVLRVRYEDVVSNQPAAGRALVDFLGLPWDPQMAAFWETARGVHISTPSHQDVARPIFTRARGRWRRYEVHLAPVMDRLNTLAESLGYETGQILPQGE